MLFKENLIYLLEKNVKILRFTGSFPYKIDPHLKYLSISEHHRKEVIKNIILLFIGIITYIQIWHGREGRFPMGVILEDSIYAGAETVFPMLALICIRRHYSITELFNMLIVIERKHQTENCKLKIIIRTQH